MSFFDSFKNAVNSLVEPNDPNANPNASSQTPPPPPAPAPAPAPAPVQDSFADDDDEAMYSPKIEKLINMALADGELTEKEKQVLFKKAEAEGIDLDEFEMVLEAKLYERTKNSAPALQTQQAAPKSDKFGDVKKCPACGAIVQTHLVKCVECGYEFNNVQANVSIEKLFMMLNDVENTNSGNSILRQMGFSNITDKKATIIQNFPVPTTKADIIEFLTQAVPLAKRPSFWNSTQELNRIADAWKSKCEQIIMKAKFSMKDDKEFFAQIEEYAKELKIKL